MGRGSSKARSATTSTATVQTDGKYNTVNLTTYYNSVQELREDGFHAVHDFSLNTLLNPNRIIGEDVQPWNGLNKYYVWDNDFKRWTQCAERKY